MMCFAICKNTLFDLVLRRDTAIRRFYSFMLKMRKVGQRGGSAGQSTHREAWLPEFNTQGSYGERGKTEYHKLSSDLHSTVSYIHTYTHQHTS